MKCPHCSEEINIGRLIGTSRSDRKAKASKENGKLGGRPKKKEIRVHGKSLAEWDQQLQDVYESGQRRCQTAFCPNIGKETLVHGMKAWLCEEHGKA